MNSTNGSPLPVVATPTVTLDDLVGFVQNPAREFLRGRLEITVPREAELPRDALSIRQNGLDEWQIGDRVLAQVDGGAALESALQREVARGGFPPGPLGAAAVDRVRTDVDWIVERAPRGRRRSVDVRLEIDGPDADPVLLTGVLTDVVGADVLLTTYSRIGPKHLLAAWVPLLALAVVEPDAPHRAILTGKKSRETLRAPDAAQADSAADSAVADDAADADRRSRHGRRRAEDHEGGLTVAELLAQMRARKDSGE